MNAFGTSPVSPSALTEADRDRVLARARHLRAEAARDIFAAVGRRLAGAVDRWVEARRLARRRAQAIAELRGVDARMLKDIGLHRSGIVAAVHGLDAADRPPQRVAPAADAPGNVVAFTNAPRRRPAKRPAPQFRARERRRRVAAG